MIEMEANLVAVARIKQYSDIGLEVRRIYSLHQYNFSRLAIGIVLSVRDAVRSGAQDRCRGFKVVPSCS